MDAKGVPVVPLPATFLFDSSSFVGSVPCRSPVACATFPSDRPCEVGSKRTGDKNVAVLNPVDTLAGCKIAFLLRSNAVEGREQGLELHVSQLRAALTELLGVHSQTYSKVQHLLAGSVLLMMQ
jgi:hypothetical protein